MRARVVTNRTQVDLLTLKLALDYNDGAFSLFDELVSMELLARSVDQLPSDALPPSEKQLQSGNRRTLSR